MDEIDRLRASAARITRRGIGMPMAGLMFWIAAAIIGATWPPKSAAVLWFVSTGLVFPIGFGLTSFAVIEIPQ